MAVASRKNSVHEKADTILTGFVGAFCPHFGKLLLTFEAPQGIEQRRA